MAEHCYGLLCFVPLDSAGPRFFGFAEFLASLALMVLVWTVADIRYRFRVAIAPIPLNGLTFGVIAVVGLMTLLTDLWRAEGWLVPRGELLTPAIWQALLGLLFLATFLTWIWYAFIRPPIYGRWNAKRYAGNLYRIILKGSSAELPVIANEVGRSAKALVRHSWAKDRWADEKVQEGENEPPKKKKRLNPTAKGYAHDILLLIADRRFCRHVVESSPGTALGLFLEISETKKYTVPIEVFAKNITSEAMANRDSFLFHESEGYSSGLLGYHKPLTQALYGNYRMVEDIGTVFDVDFREKAKWDAVQWEAYCRIVLMTFRNYVENGWGEHSFVLYRAMGDIERATADLYELNKSTSGAWDSAIYQRLRVVVRFIRDAIDILNKQDKPPCIVLRTRNENHVGSMYDNLARMIFEIIFAASCVREPRELCWSIQRNAVWGEFFNFRKGDGHAAKAIQFKVRRLLYKEISDMSRFPNFKGARILGIVLNVLGFSVYDKEYFRDSRALHKAVLSWTKKNYAQLHIYNPRIAETCLVADYSYDEENRHLVHIHPADGLRRKPVEVYLDLDPPSASSIVIED